jgi:hypothetical protein
MNSEADRIIAGMKVWYVDEKRKRDMRSGDDQRDRTPQQVVWDSAILAAAEFVRRRHGGDEKLALEIMGLLSNKLPKS